MTLTYFVGNEQHDHDELIYPLEVNVYDIHTREWMKGFRKLQAPRPAPFVFFYGQLYVLSSDISYQESL